jgi:acetyltransferase-like isoleucine patch superfamily enzyme
MFGKLLNNIANKLGRSGYKFDDSFSSSDLIELVLLKGWQLIRFFINKPRLRGSGLLNFLGYGVKLSFARNIIVGRGVFLGDHVYINALCRSGVLIGNNVTIKAGTKIDCTGVFSELGEGIVIEDRVGISENCFIQVRGPVVIEQDVIIGPSVKIFSENHDFEDPSKNIRQQGTRRLGVTICSGSWIGAGAIILDGVTIGSNSVVAAGSVVTKNVESCTVVGGNPARFLKLI